MVRKPNLAGMAALFAVNRIPGKAKALVPQRFFNFRKGNDFLVSKITDLNMVENLRVGIIRTFFPKTVHFSRNSPILVSLQIQNFLAFCDHLSTVVFSQITDMRLT